MPQTGSVAIGFPPYRYRTGLSNRLDGVFLFLEDLLEPLDADHRVVVLHGDLFARDVDVHTLHAVDRLQRVGNRALAMLARDVRYVEDACRHLTPRLTARGPRSPP